MTMRRLLAGCSDRSEECFDKLSMNGNFSAISKFSPLVLSVSKDSDKVFQHPAGS